jgi:hypothetical protein
MGWRFIGRGVLPGMLVLLAGCAVSSKLPSPEQTNQLRATMRGVYEAVERGDEAEYRRLVRLAPDDAYSDALTNTMFASIRLHQAVEKHIRDDAVRLRSLGPGDGRTMVTRPTSVASSRRSSATRPTPSVAAVDYRDNARTILRALEGWTFTIHGDRATIDQLAERPGAPSLRRVGGRWTLVPIPLDLPRNTATYRLAVEEERAMANALSTAREAIENGSATSIDDANEIIRKLLTGPATQP